MNEVCKLRDMDLKAGDLVELVSPPEEWGGWSYPRYQLVQQISERGNWFGVDKEFLHELEGLFRKV